MNKINIIRYSVSEYKVDEPKRTMDFHEHITLELSYISSGNMLFSYMNEKKEVCNAYVFPKQLLIVAPYFLHKTSIPDSLKSIGMEISLDPAGNVLEYLSRSQYVNQFRESKNLLKTLLSKGFTIVDDTGNIEHKLGKIQKYVGQSLTEGISEAKYDLDLKSLLLEVLACKQISETHEGSIHVKRALSLLENNHANKINVSFIAKTIGLSVSYLQHIFKNETGMSLNQKLNNIRIAHAQQLLAETNFAIRKIALDVGFDSVQELNFNFKKITGQTPSAFKKIKNEKHPMIYFDYQYPYDEKIENTAETTKS